MSHKRLPGDDNLVSRVVIEPVVAVVTRPLILCADGNLVCTIKLWWDRESQGHGSTTARIEGGDIITITMRSHRAHQDLEICIRREVIRLDRYG